MKIYFVRHGEGEHNAKRLYSASHFSLTDKGKKQAEVIGSRVSNLPIEIIVSSSYTRTVQTSEIINKYINKEILLTDLAIEIVRPKEIAGKEQDNPEIVKIKKQMDENFNNPKWHYSDEENFYDLKKRAEQFIEYLAGFKQKHILVVTHVHFIRMVVLVMLFGNNLTAEMFLQAMKSLEMETSGLTICQKDDHSWKLITWNDHAHLAENTNKSNGKFPG